MVSSHNRSEFRTPEFSFLLLTLTLIWTLSGGNSLRRNHRITLSDDGALAISSVVDSDKGFYTCSASDEKGEGSSASVYVSVISTYSFLYKF